MTKKENERLEAAEAIARHVGYLMMHSAGIELKESWPSIVPAAVGIDTWLLVQKWARLTGDIR